MMVRFVFGVITTKWLFTALLSLAISVACAAIAPAQTKLQTGNDQTPISGARLSEQLQAETPRSTSTSADATSASGSDQGGFAEWVAAIPTGNVLGVISQAGVMAIPIAACSVLLVMFMFERLIALRRSRVIPKHFVTRFLDELQEGQLQPEEALVLCNENGSPVSEVFAAAVKKWNRPAVEIEQAVLDAGERVANQLRRYLRLFNSIATVSPLLGLLGTVLGMISAFNSIATAQAMGRPDLLAEGISQALLTTAGGLSVAIPAYIVYMFFTSRVDRLLIEIDDRGQQVVSAIASDVWKPTATKRKPKATNKAA